MAQIDIVDKTYVATGYGSNIRTDQVADEIHYAGFAATPHGYIRVYSSPRGTHLTMLHNGRAHERWISRQYQPTYLITLARRFAEDVAAQEQEPYDAA